MSTSYTTQQAPALRLAKLLIPWMLLLFIAFRAWGIVGDFRAAQKRSARGSTETTATINGSKAATDGASKKDVVTPQKPTTSKGTVIVLIDGLNFRTEPKSSAKVTLTLDAKARLALLSKQGSWYRVRTADGKVGWVTANSRWTKLEGK